MTGTPDAGSGSLSDSLISDFAVTANGIYYVVVGNMDGTAVGLGPGTGPGYKLHVSVENAFGYAVIGAGSTAVPLTVTVLNDDLVEPSEIVKVTLSSKVLGDAQISLDPDDADKTKTVTITDEDRRRSAFTRPRWFQVGCRWPVLRRYRLLSSATDTGDPVHGFPVRRNTASGADPADHTLVDEDGDHSCRCPDGDDQRSRAQFGPDRS